MPDEVASKEQQFRGSRSGFYRHGESHCELVLYFQKPPAGYSIPVKPDGHEKRKARARGSFDRLDPENGPVGAFGATPQERIGGELCKLVPTDVRVGIQNTEIRSGTDCLAHVAQLILQLRTDQGGTFDPGEARAIDDPGVPIEARDRRTDVAEADEAADEAEERCRSDHQATA